jgi:hypothetical protein
VLNECLPDHLAVELGEPGHHPARGPDRHAEQDGGPGQLEDPRRRPPPRRSPAQPEPAARGQVGQRHPEPVPLEPPGQQADHRGRLNSRRRALVPARLGRGRQDQQDEEQEHPPSRGSGGHGKHDMPSV